MIQSRFSLSSSLLTALFVYRIPQSQASMGRIDIFYEEIVHIPCEGFPEGTKELANHRCRSEVWDGPIGGIFYFYYRGGTDDFNEFLNAYSRIDSPSIELIVVDGPSDKYFTVPNGMVDWTLSIGTYRDFKEPWESSPYEKSVGLLTVCIGGGGSITWEEVQLPKGLRVSDMRKSQITDKRDKAILDWILSLGCEVYMYRQREKTVIDIFHEKRPDPLRVGGADVSNVLREIEANMDAPVEPVSLPVGQ